jgi:hypothetical protein
MVLGRSFRRGAERLPLDATPLKASQETSHFVLTIFHWHCEHRRKQHDAWVSPKVDFPRILVMVILYKIYEGKGI